MCEPNATLINTSGIVFASVHSMRTRCDQAVVKPGGARALPHGGHVYEVDEPSACGKTQTHGAFANVRQHSSRKRHGFRSVLEGTWHLLRTPTTLNDDPEDHRRLTFATAVSQDDLEDMERHAFTTADGVEHHYFRRETSPRATSPRAAQHWGHARAAGRLTGLAGRTRRAATLG